jgi:hypothetical protein
MEIRHIVAIILVFILGYWVAGQYPGILSKTTGGVISG